MSGALASPDDLATNRLPPFEKQAADLMAVQP
jgi:hypothetical protein